MVAKERYNLDNITAFVKALNIKQQFKAIHISGTNGKTSVAFFLYLMLRAAGYSVGIFSSPHLKPTDQILINKPISALTYQKIKQKYQDAFAQFQLTPFEQDVIIMIEYFNTRVTMAIVEVGMGGALDATNIINSFIAVITNVHLEHQHYLGKTLAQIATNKSGIIKPKSEVVCGRLGKKLKEMLNRICCEKGSHFQQCEGQVKKNNNKWKLIFKNDSYLFTGSYYQAQNALLAIKVAQLLKLEKSAIVAGLTRFYNPARYQKWNNIIIDGAHNVAAIKMLIKSLIFDNINGVIVFACFKDKNYQKMLNLLEQYSCKIYLCHFDHPRAMSSKVLQQKFLYPIIEMEQIIELSKYQQVIVTGSLAFCQLFMYNHLRNENT